MYAMKDKDPLNGDTIYCLSINHLSILPQKQGGMGFLLAFMQLYLTDFDKTVDYFRLECIKDHRVISALQNKGWIKRNGVLYKKVQQQQSDEESTVN